MKNTTTKTTIIIICLVAALVGYYAYLSNRSKERIDDTEMTVVQSVLSRDLTKDYPATPKEVLKYYNDIMECFYNEECTEEEIDELGYKARELYDEELLANNELGTYLIRLHAEVDAFKTAGRRITSSSVAASTNVDFYEVDGYSFARLLSTYNVMDGGMSQAVKTIYLLRKDENKKLKIYGWDAESNVNLDEGKSGE